MNNKTVKEIILEYLQEIEEMALDNDNLQLYADTMVIENIIERVVGNNE